jgi:hypothetical protein
MDATFSVFFAKSYLAKQRQPNIQWERNTETADLMMMDHIGVK